MIVPILFGLAAVFLVIGMVGHLIAFHGREKIDRTSSYDFIPQGWEHRDNQWVPIYKKKKAGYFRRNSK